MSFRRKKTTGTLMLFTAYIILVITRTLSSIQKTLQVVTGNFGNFALYSTAISIVVPIVTVIFLYTFACRGIFRDSEYLRTITIVALSIIVGISITVLIMNLYVEVPEGFFSIEYKNSTAEIVTYSVSFVNILVILVQVLIYLRITISSFILARNSDEITRKRGFQFIAIGSLLFLVGGLMIGALSAIDLGLGMTIVMETIRRLIFLTSYYMLYVGWTLPDWFRRRLRHKSWFEKQYTTPVA